MEKTNYPLSCSSLLGKHHVESYIDHNIDGSPESEKATQRMFNIFIKRLLELCEFKNKLNIFAHNLSSFDGVLILRYLTEFGQVDPLLHNGKLMSIRLTINKGTTLKFIDGTSRYFKKTIVLDFKDSYLFLPYSLRKLCKYFPL